MTDNPYRSPADDALPANAPVIGVRWYHVPFIIAVLCGLALAMISQMTFVSERHFATCVAICAGLLAIDLPVCGLLFREWWTTGEPPKFYWEAPYVTASRALRRTLKQRPQLDDDTFYATFYINSGIAKEIVISVRSELQAMLGHRLAGIHPQDHIELIEPALDVADILDDLAEPFGAMIPWRPGEVNIDDTFDSLVRIVADCIERRDTQ